jgi:hypothetical protein
MLRRSRTRFSSAGDHGRLCAIDPECNYRVRSKAATRLLSVLQLSHNNTRKPAMNKRYLALCGAAVLAAVALQGTSAHALSMTECGAKYKAAKTAGTLNGMKWNDFRKANCGSDATAAPAAAPASTPVATGSAVFPSVVNSKYSKDSAGKARRETCLDQYNANKASNGNGNLKWIQKGGGYYSECNKKLKGA